MKKEIIHIEPLKKRISKSDEAAFRAVFDFYYPRLLNYAFVIIKNHESAEDIVLEVLHGVWERRKKIKEIDNFSNYLYVCTRNKTLEYHRRNTRFVNIEFNEAHYKEYFTHLNPENKLIGKEFLEIIDQSILNLPEKTRLVYRLVKEEGMKYQEVADLLGTSPKTVNNQILRAMKEIRTSTIAYLNKESGRSFLGSLMSFIL